MLIPIAIGINTPKFILIINKLLTNIFPYRYTFHEVYYHWCYRQTCYLIKLVLYFCCLTKKNYNMKKTLFIAIVIIASISLNTLNAQVKGGFKMGVDFSNMKESLKGESINDMIDSKRLITPRIGFIIEVGINEYLFIQTGLFGSARGHRSDAERVINEKTYDSKEYQVMLFVDLPVNIGYKYDLGGAKLFAMAGPVLSYGIYSTLLYYADDEWDNDQQHVGNSLMDDFKPLNFGINIEGGVEFNRFQFTAFYLQGLSELSNAPDINSTKTNVFGLTAAVKFGRVD